MGCTSLCWSSPGSVLECPGNGATSGCITGRGHCNSAADGCWSVYNTDELPCGILKHRPERPGQILDMPIPDAIGNISPMHVERFTGSPFIEVRSITISVALLRTFAQAPTLHRRKLLRGQQGVRSRGTSLCGIIILHLGKWEEGGGLLEGRKAQSTG